MLSGRDTLGMINQRIGTARHGIDDIHRRMTALSERVDHLRKNTTDQYRKLAKFRLDEMAARGIIGRLDAMDEAVLRLLKQKLDALHDIKHRIEDSVAEQEKLAENRRVLEKERDHAFEILENRAGDIRDILSEQTHYQAQIDRCKQTAMQAENADKKADQAENDQATKGKPYEADSLFMYLWKRKYLTPDYKGRGIARMLDGWMARLIDYQDTRPNYFMLTELPVRLREHATRVSQAAELEVEALKQIEKSAAEKAGLPKFQSRVLAVEKELNRIDEKISDAEKRHEGLIAHRAVFSAGEDDFSHQAIDLQVARLKERDIRDLYSEAVRTRSPKDDVIVSRIGELENEEHRIEKEIKTLRHDELQSQKMSHELEQLRRRFRHKRYETQYSGFPSGFNLGVLLDQLMRGMATGDTVWDQIRRSQTFRRPRWETSSRSGGGFWGRIGGGSGGGFGGGFGGGGGGGFRTGGGF